MKTSNQILLLILGFALILCNLHDIETEPGPEPEPINHKIEWFPESPKSIVDLNTEYDDYNSYLNIVGKRIDLYYSTNKDSKGNNFDISSRCIDAVLELDTDIFYFLVSNSEPFIAFRLLPIINSQFDEYGPFFFYSDSVINSYTRLYFMYANNENENFDIRYAYVREEDGKLIGPFEANVLNSEYDDYYPTINADYSKMFFSSNRGQNFDIYEIDMDFENIVDWLKNGTNNPEINNILSSPNDDKCPYIKGNLMVFASNNSSGYGGYDLWYSIFENGKWNEPQNFGAEINTEYDEYRPAIEYFPDSNNDLMIFSSNRPEGKGGFDLYYTGILKMIKK